MPRFEDIAVDESPFIRLDQFMKALQLVVSGGEAKHIIQGGEVQVNGETETRRGRKLRHGDTVGFLGDIYEVTLEDMPQG